MPNQPMPNQPIPNQPIPGHALIGQTVTYRPDLPSYDPDLDTSSPGALVVAPGLPCTVKAVFRDWNGITGLWMLYVYCHATSQHTHLSPSECRRVIG